MKKCKLIIFTGALVISIFIMVSCSCVKCTYNNAKSSIITYISSLFTPPKNEIIDLINDFTIRNPNVDWSFVVPYSRNISVEDKIRVQIVNIDSVSIKDIGWYKKIQGIKFWTVTAKLAGEYSVNSNEETEFGIDRFEKTLVLFLYKAKEGWKITHIKNDQRPGIKLTPIFKAGKRIFKLTTA